MFQTLHEISKKKKKLGLWLYSLQIPVQNLEKQIDSRTFTAQGPPPFSPSTTLPKLHLAVSKLSFLDALALQNIKDEEECIL